MKTTFPFSRILGATWFTLVGLVSLSGCKEDPSPSLFQPIASAPAPVISSITPPPPALAGVTTLTLTGTNFSPVKENNLVFFDAIPGTVLEASASQLRVRPPILVKDSIKIKVAVTGSELFSETRLYRMESATFKIDSIRGGEEPWAVAIDSLGNIYVSISGNGVKRIPPSGARTDWTSRTITVWQSMKFGPDGILYAAWNLNAIARLTGGGANPVFWVPLPAGVKIKDFAFDTQGNLWAAGNNTAMYRITPARSVKSFPLNAAVRAVRIYNGFLYLGGTIREPDTAGVEKIVRYRILSSDSLGPQESYFDLSTSSLGGTSKYIYSMAFTSSGDLLVGTDRAVDPLLLVRTSDRAAEVFYTGVFTPTPHILAWGRGSNLYLVRGSASSGSVGSSIEVLRVNAGVSGAP